MCENGKWGLEKVGGEGVGGLCVLEVGEWGVGVVLDKLLNIWGL